MMDEKNKNKLTTQQRKIIKKKTVLHAEIQSDMLSHFKFIKIDDLFWYKRIILDIKGSSIENTCHNWVALHPRIRKMERADVIKSQMKKWLKWKDYSLPIKIINESANIVNSELQDLDNTDYDYVGIVMSNGKTVLKDGKYVFEKYWNTHYKPLHLYYNNFEYKKNLKSTDRIAHLLKVIVKDWKAKTGINKNYNNLEKFLMGESFHLVNRNIGTVRIIVGEQGTAKSLWCDVIKLITNGTNLPVDVFTNKDKLGVGHITHHTSLFCNDIPSTFTSEKIPFFKTLFDETTSLLIRKMYIGNVNVKNISTTTMTSNKIPSLNHSDDAVRSRVLFTNTMSKKEIGQEEYDSWNIKGFRASSFTKEDIEYLVSLFVNAYLVAMNNNLAGRRALNFKTDEDINIWDSIKNDNDIINFVLDNIAIFKSDPTTKDVFVKYKIDHDNKMKMKTLKRLILEHCPFITFHNNPIWRDGIKARRYKFDNELYEEMNKQELIPNKDIFKNDEEVLKKMPWD